MNCHVPFLLHQGNNRLSLLFHKQSNLFLLENMAYSLKFMCMMKRP